MTAKEETGPILIEKEWDEDGYAIQEECAAKKLETKSMTKPELRAMKTEAFLNSQAYFVSLDVLRHHVEKHPRFASLVPDTYPSEFKELYHRRIWTSRAEGISQFPVFIKPRENKKDWGGRVVNDKVHLPQPKEELYVSEVVVFHHEQRIIIGDGVIYAIGTTSIPCPPQAFLDQVMKCAGATSYRFLCIDVALIPAMRCWAVVEVNPPFCIGDNGCDLSAYIRFTIDVCRHVRATLD